MAASRSATRRRSSAAITALVALSAASPALAGTISGTAFYDYNADGTFNPSSSPAAPARDTGVEGVTVTAYASAGTPLDTTTTAANGTFTLSLGAESRARVEFSGLPAGTQPSAAGQDSRGRVRFADVGATNVSFGLVRPGDYCQNDPALAASCFLYGQQTAGSPNAGGSALLSFPQASRGFPFDATFTTGPSADYTGAPTTLAAASQVGSVFGLAWSSATRRLYSSAFVRAQSGLGAGGPGAIYATDPDSAANATVHVDLNDVFGPGTAGSDPHVGLVNPLTSPKVEAILSGAPIDTFRRNTVAADVAKLGLGDLDVSADGSTLYAVNLSDRRIYEVPTAGTPSLANIERASIPVGGTASYPCPLSDLRPFGLGVLGSRVFVGVVCSAESSGVTDGTFQNGVTSPTTSLAAYVWEYDASTNSFDAAPELELPLDYSRAGATTAAWVKSDSPWEPWQATLATAEAQAGPPLGPSTVNPQPILADIAFDANGDMILGLRDRFADQAPNEPYSSINFANRSTSQGAGIAGGDLLHACVNAGSWTLETAGGCAGRGSGVPNNEGPGGGEYYSGDRYGTYHEEVLLGGLAQVPGFPEVGVASHQPTSYSAAAPRFGAGGVRFLDNLTGIYIRGFELYGADTPGNFANAGGIGGIEALCDAAPIEVGGRVWIDVDRDGSQGAAEPGLAGVRVVLRKAGSPVGQALTDADGTYRFSSAIVTDANPDDAIGAGPQVGMTGYTITIDAAQSPLTAKVRTSANTGLGADADLNDSDALAAGLDAEIAVSDALILPGYNDHSNDAGFQPAYSLGNRVFVDANRSGTIDAADGANPGRAGVTLELLDGASAPILVGGAPVTTVTDANGFYLFDNLAAGSYRVRVAASSLATGAPLGGFRSTTTSLTGPDDGTDSDDNGVDAAPGTAVVSAAVVLGPGYDEPLGDLGGGPSHGVTSDDRSDLTLDFGFYAPSTIGDRVWHDLDHDGQQDDGEPGIQGASVTLRFGGSDLRSTVTDSEGRYRFDELDPGTYQLRLALPAGFEPTLYNRGDDSTDSDLDPPSLRTGPIVLGVGEKSLGNDLGAWKPAFVSGLVWADLDANGLQGGSESPSGGLLVSLLLDGVPVQTTRTGPTGGYRFEGLITARLYQVEVAVPGGMAIAPEGTGDDTRDSDADPATGRIPAFILEPGQAAAHHDIGLVVPTSLVARVFLDDNSNGIPEPGERGLEGSTVRVLDWRGQQVGIAITDTDGVYRISGLAIGGSYRLQTIAPSGFSARLAPERLVTLASGFKPIDLALLPALRTPQATGRAKLVVRVSGPGHARRGTLVTYIVRVTNGARGTVARDVRLSGVLGGAKLISASVGRRVSGGRAAASLGRLRSGETRVMRLRVRIIGRARSVVAARATATADNAARVSSIARGAVTR